MSQDMRGGVNAQQEVRFSDLATMFEELETTGTVTVKLPNPCAEEDAALLSWLTSGYKSD